MGDVNAVQGSVPAMEVKSLAMMDAVIELISQHGIDAVRLQDVAQLAGVSVGAVQYHFNSRTELIDRAMRRHAAEWIEGVTPPADVPTAWEALCVMFDSIALRAQDSTVNRVWLMLNTSALTNIEHLRLAQHIDTRWRSIFRELLVRGITTGEFVSDATVEENVDAIMAAVDGISLKYAVSGVGGGDSAGHAARALIRLAQLMLQPDAMRLTAQ